MLSSFVSRFVASEVPHKLDDSPYKQQQSACKNKCCINFI
jgi:hypothetical protein